MGNTRWDTRHWWTGGILLRHLIPIWLLFTPFHASPSAPHLSHLHLLLNLPPSFSLPLHLYSSPHKPILFEFTSILYRLPFLTFTLSSIYILPLSLFLASFLLFIIYLFFPFVSLSFSPPYPLSLSLSLLSLPHSSLPLSFPPHLPIYFSSPLVSPCSLLSSATHLPIHSPPSDTTP